MGKQHALSGLLAIQPSIQVGNRQLLLDELLGNQFALISTKSIPLALATNFKNRVTGEVFLLGKDFQSETFTDWMLAHKMEWVIIRPDRYIFDAGKIKELEDLLSQLFKML